VRITLARVLGSDIDGAWWAPATDYDLSMYLRPSRYAEAEKFFGFAATEFGQYADSTTLLENVSSWVGTRLNYVSDSSDPIDGAIDTLLAPRQSLVRIHHRPRRRLLGQPQGCHHTERHRGDGSR
jgi:hypothetical protein